MIQNNLVHSGTKGMKWGQRLYQYKDGSLTPLGKARYGRKGSIEKKTSSVSTSSKTADKSDTKPKKRSIKELSDEELGKRIIRLEQEKKYRELLASEPGKKKIYSGKRFIEKVLIPSGEDIAKQVSNALLAKAVNKAFKDEVVYANNKKKGN